MYARGGSTPPARTITKRPEPEGSGLFVFQAAVGLSSSQHFRQECARRPNPFHLSLVVSADCTEYGLAGEEFTVNAAGQSYISYADYAIAVVDEAEQAAHVGERISVYAK